MPLYGFMKDTDRNRISSITPTLNDRSRARRIYPPKYSLKSNVYEKIYVADCQTHIGGVSVPVELRRRADNGYWEVWGIARCCPICWLILVDPDGVKEPEVKPQDYGDLDPDFVSTTKKLSRYQRGHRSPRQKSPSKIDVPAVALWAKKLGTEFDIYQVTEQFGVSRGKALMTLNVGTRLGFFNVTRRRGRGQKTTWSLQEKEA